MVEEEELGGKNETKARERERERESGCMCW